MKKGKDKVKNVKQKNKHGGAQEESTLIKKYADQWCKDNDYPIQKRYFVYRKKDNEKN